MLFRSCNSIIDRVLISVCFCIRSACREHLPFQQARKALSHFSVDFIGLRTLSRQAGALSHFVWAAFERLSGLIKKVPQRAYPSNVNGIFLELVQKFILVVFKLNIEVYRINCAPAQYKLRRSFWCCYGARWNPIKKLQCVNARIKSKRLPLNSISIFHFSHSHIRLTHTQLTA